MIDPRFQQAEAQYRRLRAEYDGGTLAKEPYEAALRALMIEHEGRYWSLGAGSGRWFVSEGQSWVEATPPGMDAPPPGLPDAAPPAHPPAPAGSAPQPATAAPPPRPTAPVARPASGRGQGLLRFGVGLLVVGGGSFVLPFFGMQLRLLNLFGEGSQPVVGVAIAVLGLVLVIAGASMGGGPAPAPPPPTSAPRPAAAGVPPGYTPQAYTPRGPGGCIVGCLIAVGAVVLLFVVGFLLAWPRIQAEIALLRAQAAAEANSSQAPAYTPTGLPPCPPGYTPPPPSLGPDQPAPTCTPTGQ